MATRKEQLAQEVATFVDQRKVRPCLAAVLVGILVLTILGGGWLLWRDAQRHAADARDRADAAAHRADAGVHARRHVHRDGAPRDRDALAAAGLAPIGDHLAGPAADRAAVLRVNPSPIPETKRDWSGTRSHQASREVMTWRKIVRWLAPGAASQVSQSEGEVQAALCP